MSSRNFENRAPISKRTVDAVMTRLMEVGHPATIKELIGLTGRSYNTVKLALETGGARPLGEYPERYEPGEYVALPASSMPFKGVALLVPQVEDLNEFTARWNRGRNAFAERLGELAVHPAADPITLIRQFTTAASTLATMADQLEKVKDKPDWYELLVGESVDA